MHNFRANTLIKDIISKNKKLTYDIANNQKCIRHIFDIYDQMEESRSHFVINSILKACIQFKSPIQSSNQSKFWKDVNHVITTPNMQYKGSISYPLLLKYCIKTNDFKKGADLINSANLKRRTDNIFIQTALIDFYGYFKDLENAKYIFHLISDSNKDYVCIGSIMKVVVDNDDNGYCLALYDTYTDKINDVCYVLSIKACINLNNESKGKEIHSQLMLPQNTKYQTLEVKNALMDFYGHFGEIDVAIDIFHGIPDKEKDAVTIGCILKGYVNNNRFDEALEIYDKYNERFPNDVSNVFAIKACTATGDYDKGKSIHTKIISRKRHLAQQLNTSLMDFYLHFGDVKAAQIIFHGIDNKDKTNAMISCMIKGLINNGLNKDALIIYDQHYTLTNNYIHSLILKACINTNNFQKGIDIIDKHNLLNDNDDNVIVQTGLIEFYGYFNDMESAQNVFKSIDQNQLDIVSINSMIANLVDNDNHQIALNLFDQFKNKYHLNDVTFLMAIKACTSMGQYDRGKEIFKLIEKDSYLQQSVELNNTLIDFFGSAGDIDKAIDIFNSIDNDNKDIFSIGAMMEAYYTNEYHTQCLDLFQNINSFNDKIIKPNVVCYCIALKACTQNISYHLGEQIHDILKNEKSMLNDMQIQINLMNFYGKCGKLDICKDIFKKSKHRKDISIWNALINAYAKNGKMKKIKKLYSKIKDTEMYESVDRKLFIALINACSHCGDVEYANEIWNKEIMNENIKYDSYLISSLVDCFARQGMIDRAKTIINAYEEYKEFNGIADDENDRVMWMSLLSGCRSNPNKEVAQNIYQEINDKFKDKLDAKYNESMKLLIANIYSLCDSSDATATG